MSKSRTRSGEQLRQVTSAIHKGRPCNPCHLCKQGNLSKYVHPKSWKNEELLGQLRRYEPDLDIQPDTCICRLCRDDIGKINDENFTPRWRKNNNNKMLCIVPECNQVSSKTTKLVDHSTLCSLLHIDLSMCTLNKDGGFPLCGDHYGILYRQLNPFQHNCKTCNKVLHDISKARKCPNPSIIQKFLSDNHDFVQNISDTDRICNTCYKSQLVLIKHATNSVESMDSDLNALISQLKSQLSELTTIKTTEELVSYTMSFISIHVGEVLLDQGALLLPNIYEMFCNKLGEISKIYNIEVSPSNKITKVMLRNHLSAVLEPHMAYRCYAKRYGTIIYRHSGDLVFTANKLLSASRQQKEVNDFQQTLKNVCETLNTKLHHTIDKLIQQDTQQPQKIEDVNIDECVAQIDPDVWTALNILTKPRRASSNYTRLVRRFFCVCVLFFTTNSQCSFPLHTLLTDAIETCGGSGRLTKLFNRLGACASADTHARYVQYRVELSKQHGVLDGYPSEANSVVTIDNLDFIHSFARIYSGKLQLSWHGTTIQIVIPTPNNIAQPERNRVTQCKRTLPSRSPLSQQPEDMRSPVQKKERRSRTGTECARRNILPQLELMTGMSPSVSMDRTRMNNISLTMDNFHLSPDETKAQNNLINTSFYYVLTKKVSEKNIIDFPSYYGLLHDIPVPECSKVIYYGILNQKCDTKDTIRNIVNQLYTEFIVTKKKQWIILEGDQLTYSLIASVKSDYGNDLSWLIPVPGDWHVLKNFQEVIQKAYFDGGLIDLARACGYQPNSIGKNFKRMHHFIIETWEALYRYFLSLFWCTENNPDPKDVTMWLNSLPESPDQHSASRNLKQLLDDINEKNPNFQNNFLSFMNQNANKNKTWKLWKQYVLEDCFAYVSLHLAIRTGNWKLRMCALKNMAALFSAFDRPNYQRLISDHIVDVSTISQDILTFLEDGGWIVSLTGRPCHCVGLDECHEMCINKDGKAYVTRPSSDNLERKAIFMPIRAKAMKQLESQLYPEKTNRAAILNSIYSSTASDKQLEINIKCQVAKLGNSSLKLDCSESTLCHLFNSKRLTPEQEHDLLNFREIGQKEFENRIKYYVLKTPSVKPPKKRTRLLTFTERKSNKRKVSDIEKERRLQLECWKKRVAYSTATGQLMDNMYEQYIDLPRAISTSDGEPNKGTKSVTTTVYLKRYEEAMPTPFVTRFPTGWLPSIIIMEGMFLINIIPWDAHTTIGSYADFLMRQHIMPHYRNGATEVHVLFDNPKCNSLKHFERLKRDRANPVPDTHYCTNFSADLHVPSQWSKQVLSCRKCKRNLVCFLSQYFLHKMKQHLLSGQTFITAGGLNEPNTNKAMSIQSRGSTQEEPQLYSNAEETDTRIWLHVVNAQNTNILVLSPDTDVYHIGLPIVANTNKKVYVQLSKFTEREVRLVDMQALINAFSNDPNLAVIPDPRIPLIIQILFVSTGCDCISYFHGLGKTSFLNTLFDYAEFICSSEFGMLTDEDEKNSFISFLRLVGCTYFRKHKSVFLPAYPTPMALFNSFSKDFSGSSFLHHGKWLDAIRERVWSKIKYEEEMVPSVGALERHWKRSRYIMNTWKQCTQNVTTYQPLEEHGWKFKDGVLTFDWDSDEHMSLVRNRVALIKKGCGCKTGCNTNRCKCRRYDVHCGPGCTCHNCANHPATNQRSVAFHGESDSDELDSGDELDGEGSEDVEDIMRSVFGEGDYFIDNSSVSSGNMDI